MRYLLDTNVISELRKPPRRADPGVHRWAAAQVVSDLAISVVTVMEVEIGVARLGRKDRDQGDRLRLWLEDDLLPTFARRTVPVDLAVVRRAAALHVPDPRPDRDALIAATALVHGLRVITRNVADFAGMDVDLLNPWAGTTDSA